MADYLDFPGFRGIYRYWVLTGQAKSEPGNYMFIKQTLLSWVPVYVGIAIDLNTRLSYHNMWAGARRFGATHVVAHTNANANARLAEEADLIAYWNPVCNTQHRTILGGLG